MPNGPAKKVANSTTLSPSRGYRGEEAPFTAAFGPAPLAPPRSAAVCSPRAGAGPWGAIGVSEHLTSGPSCRALPTAGSVTSIQFPLCVICGWSKASCAVMNGSAATSYWLMKRSIHSSAVFVCICSCSFS